MLPTILCSNCVTVLFWNCYTLRNIRIIFQPIVIFLNIYKEKKPLWLKTKTYCKTAVGGHIGFVCFYIICKKHANLWFLPNRYERYNTSWWSENLWMKKSNVLASQRYQRHKGVILGNQLVLLISNRYEVRSKVKWVGE